MCLSETSLVAIICSSIVMIGSLITTYITLHNHSLEKYKMKQEAILKALKFLDTYCSYLDIPNSPTPERDSTYNSTKMTLEARECYAKLCVTVDSESIPEEFLNIVMGRSKHVFQSLYSFRNLSRKELGLNKIQYDEDFVFLSIISSRALKEKGATLNIKEH